MTLDEKTESFTTSCKPCIFAQWEEGVQKDDCDLGRLVKYKQQNKATPHPDGYFIIQTVCNACRGEVWANHNLGRDLVTKVEEEIRLKLAFVLYSIDEDREKVLRKLPDKVRECVRQKQIKPEQIVVVIRNFAIEYNEIFSILKEECGDIEFKLIKIIDLSANFERCIDMAVQKCYSRYYATFDLCSNIPANLIQTLNNIINVDLKPLSMVMPNYGTSGLIIQTSLHRIFGGNKEQPIYTKIIEASKIQQKEDYIYTWEQLWKTHE